MRTRSPLLPLLLTVLSLGLVAHRTQAADTTAPSVASTIPADGASVFELRTVEVFFDEAVLGVDVTDLLLNNVPATNLVQVNSSQFLFSFNQPANGTVTVTWAAGHGITDEAGNPFVANSWTYNLDPALAINEVRINEFLADNETGIRDEDGTYQDWIELYNNSSLTVNLEGCFLTDTKLKLDNWRFPAVFMAPKTYLLVWASNKNRTNNVANLHTSFRLDPDGEYLAFVGRQTNVISAFDPEYPPQRADVSYGRDALDPNITGYYSQPSPRAVNPATGSGSDFSADVYPSRESGTFVTPFSLSLSTGSTNAVIRYIAFTNLPVSTIIPTNVPGPTSPIYTGAIPVSATMQVRVRSFEPGKLPSTPMTFTFIQISPSLTTFSSDLPQMVFTTFGQGLAASGDGTAYVMLFDNALDRSSLTNRPDLSTRAGVNDRGSSTGGQPKNNMAVEFWDEFNQDTDKPFLNMPPESDWVLYGINGFDPSLMHNAIFHWFGRSVGYSSRTRYVEVWRKTDFAPLTTNDYWGLYLAEEKPKRNKNRTNIENLQPENTNAVDITGGYLLKIDRQDSDEVSFGVTAISVPSAPYGGQTTIGGQSPIFISPNLTPSTLSDPRRIMQRNWIQSYMNQFMTNLTSPNWTNPTGYRAYIDVNSWVDSLIINSLTFNVDGYRLSGFFFKDRGKKLEQGPPWDCDRCLGTGGSINTPQADNRPWNPRVWRTYAGDLSNDQGTDFFGRSNVGVNWFNALFRDPDFWQTFIDRYQEFRRGKFSNQAVTDMVEGFYQEIKEAQVREQNRWAIRQAFTWPRAGRSSVTTGPVIVGGVTYSSTYAFDFGPTNVVPGARVFGYYSNEVNFQKQWLLDRMDFMDTNFLAMPTLSLAEGQVTSGTTVMVQPAAKPGTVLYYTLDGTDPRLSGGAISPSALTSAGPLTLNITGNVRLFVRCYNPNHFNLTNTAVVGNPPINSFWSGPQVASYYTSIPPLRITEIMYHPSDPPLGNTNDADNFEFIEVKNIGGAPLNVNRFRLRGGIEFDFPNTVLAPGQQAVVVSHQAAFQSRYGGTPLVLGTYTNHLGNDGDHIVLEGGLREPILDFNYSDEWYPITDGSGFSLQIINENDPVAANWGLKTSWRPSGTVQGTPGAADPGAPPLPTVYVNEALTHTDPSPGDAIELYNPNASAADVSGWYLTDSFNNPKKFRIPNGTSIPANGYLVYYESNSFGAGPDGFALSSKGDAVYLFSADLAGNLTGYFHGFDFGAQANGVTFGRHVISTGEDHFPAQSAPTLGGPNSGPLVGPIVITEINYHPVDYSYPNTRVDDSMDEYIELHNISSSPAPLSDPLHPENTWQLRDAVNYTFPQGVIVPPNGYLLVVGFTPTNGPTLDAFRAFYDVPAGLPIYGPWSGKLDNSEASIELTRPDLPDPPGTPSAGFVPYILADKVNYHDQAPWPTNADGLGFTLQRVDAAAYGNDPANWRAGGHSPGAALAVGGTPPTITAQPVNTIGIETYPTTFTVGATGSEPLGYQWLFNGLPIRGANGPVLTLNNLRLNQAGLYSCLIANAAGQTLSSNATLTIRQVVRIQQHPGDVRLRGSTNSINYGFTTNNATFTVAATGTGLLRYQWRFNGQNIPGATGSTLTVLNVGLTNDGLYDVVITDDIAPVTSLPARLLVLIPPVFLQAPFTQIVATNGTMSVCAIIQGNPAPFRFEWREISTIRGSFLTSDTTNYFSYGPITNTAARQWRLVVFNDANPSPGSLASFNVSAVPDADNDGIPDTWETSFGFDPNSSADGSLDTDGDGLSNYEEYLVGTDPTNSLSNLRIDLITTPGTATVQVGAVAGRTYTVQYTDDFDSGTWQRLIDVVARTTNHVETIPDPNYTANRFYRIVYPRQP